MKRADLEKYLGKHVKIILFDGDIVLGYLHKTGEEMFENEPNLYIPKNLYFVTLIKESNIAFSYLFKVSHIKKLEELN